MIDGRWLGGEALSTGDGTEHRGAVPGSLATLFGKLFAPIALVMGVAWEDAAKVGNLLGTKICVTEFIAYERLTDLVGAGQLSERSVTIALCGFANFGSIGIQLGGLGAIAPERRGDLARLALRAMFGGALASWTTAAIAGLLL